MKTLVCLSPLHVLPFSQPNLLAGRVYSNTRMDNIWAFRQAYALPNIYSIHTYISSRYDKARQIKEAQDTYCAKASKSEWSGLGEFPQDLQWEALVDVLRGRVKVGSAYCI